MSPLAWDPFRPLDSLAALWSATSQTVGPAALYRSLRRTRLPARGVDVHPDGSTLWVRLRAVHARERRWSVPARLPAYPVRLRALPSGLQVTRIEQGPGVVHLHGVLPMWRKPMPTGRLNDLLRQVRSASKLLDLSSWSGRRPGDDTAD